MIKHFEPLIVGFDETGLLKILRTDMSNFMILVVIVNFDDGIEKMK